MRMMRQQSGNGMLQERPMQLRMQNAEAVLVGLAVIAIAIAYAVARFSS